MRSDATQTTPSLSYVLMFFTHIVFRELELAIKLYLYFNKNYKNYLIQIERNVSKISQDFARFCFKIDRKEKKSRVNESHVVN
jgi:hypothetical protein